MAAGAKQMEGFYRRRFGEKFLDEPRRKLYFQSGGHGPIESGDFADST